MNIKFLQRLPRFQTLAFTALASLGACSSAPNATDSPADGDQAMLDGSADMSLESVPADVPLSASTKHSAADGHFGQRRAPEVQRTPFQSDGRWMNAFYIVRSSTENWESLSQLIYGRPDRADMISKWNQQGTLKVGRVVYYNSALRPEDTAAMKVLAEDFNIAMEKIEVKAGDSLSSIGGKFYGDVQTWREIAALNPQIASPDVIQPGQVLTVQPAQLNTQGVLDQVIAQANVAPAAETAVADTDINKIEAAPAVAQVDQTAATPAAGTVAPPTSPTSGESSQGLPVKLGIGLIAVCLVVLLVRRWLANKKARDDWSADAINVTKLSQPGN